MTEQEFRLKWNQHKAQLQQFVRRPAHVIMATEALKWVKDNYLQEQWFNGTGWQKWKKPKRYDPKGPTSAQYGTLLSKRRYLFGSIHKDAGENRAVIFTRVPYAAAHNEGAEFDQTIPITKQMRKWAWAMYYQNGGGQKLGKRGSKTAKGRLQILMGNVRSNPVADKYKALALTKNTVIQRHVRIPKRPFLYSNAELARVLRERLKGEIKKIMGF